MKKAASVFVLVLAACSSDIRHHVVHAPKATYDIDFELHDLGGCCSSFMKATLSNRDPSAPDKTVELARIHGATQTWVGWRHDNELEIYACNATRVEYRSAIVLSRSGASLLVSVTNLVPVKVGGTRLCSPPAVPNPQSL